MLEEVLRKFCSNVLGHKKNTITYSPSEKQLKQYRFQVSTPCQKIVFQAKENSPGRHPQQEEHPRMQQEIEKPIKKEKK